MPKEVHYHGSCKALYNAIYIAPYNVQCSCPSPGRVGGSSREAFLLDYPRHRIVWESARPPLSQCSERLFYEDLMDFLEWYRVRL